MGHALNRILYAYVLVIVVLPLLALPVIMTQEGSQEGILAALVLCIAGIAATCGLLMSALEVRRSQVAIIFLSLLFPSFALVSAAINGWSTLSLWGSAFEVGTVGSLVLFSSFIIASSLISRDQIRPVLHTFLGTAIITGAVWAFLSIAHVFGGAVLPGLQLSLLIAVALLLAAVCFDFTPSGRMRVVYAGCVVVLSVEFIMFNHFQATGLLCAFACFQVIRDTFPFFSAGKPAPLAVAAVAFFSAGILLFTPQALPMSSDVRPSLPATVRVIGMQYQTNLSNTLVGYGPNMVSVAWDHSRDAEFNRGARWNTPILYAYSTVSTFLITLGLLGFFVFLVVPLELFRRMRDRSVISLDSSLSNIIFVPVLFLYASFFICNADIILFLLAGVMLGFSARAYTDDAEPFIPVRGSVRAVLATLLICVAVGSGYIASREAVAVYYYSRGMTDGDSNPASASLLARAADTWNVPRYTVSAGLAYTALASSYSATRASSSEDADRFKNSVLSAVRFANIAVSEAPFDYSSSVFRASLYISLIAVKFPGAAEAAQMSITAARAQSISRPEAYFLQAQLDAALGNIPVAREDIKKALELKPDYDDALRLKEQLSSHP
jgi:hypothetical protein